MKVMIEVATTSLDPKEGMMITELEYYNLDSDLEPTKENIISVITEFNKTHKFRLNPKINGNEKKKESYISRVTYEENIEKRQQYRMVQEPFVEFPFSLNYITLGIYPYIDGNFGLEIMGYPAEQLFRMSKIITK